MYCPTCNALNSDSARFCGTCGQRLQPDQQSSPEPELPFQQQRPEPERYEPPYQPQEPVPPEVREPFRRFTYGEQSEPPPPFDPTGPLPHVPNYLVQSILVTIFCCLPLGIAAIIFAAQVNGKVGAGDIAGAESASRTAKTLCKVGFGIGIVVTVIWIVTLFVPFAPATG